MELETYLLSSGVWHRFVDKVETIHTADASRTTGIEGRMRKRTVLDLEGVLSKKQATNVERYVQEMRRRSMRRLSETTRALE